MVRGAWGDRSSSGPEQRISAHGSGAGASSKRVGPALLENGAEKARKKGVSGWHGGSSDGSSRSGRSSGGGGKDGRMHHTPGPIDHPPLFERKGRKTREEGHEERREGAGQVGVAGQNGQTNEKRVGGGDRIHPANYCKSD